MLNYETILSSYDDRLTLLQWLKKVEAALANASFENFEVVSLGDATYKFKASFADGSEIESNEIRIGERISSAYIGAGNTLHLVTESGDDIDAGALFNGDLNVGGDLSVAGDVTGNVNFTGNVSAETLTQRSANYSVTLTPSTITGFDLISSYCKLNWINGELHLIFCVSYKNTSGAAASFPNYDVYIPSIPAIIGDKIYDMGGKKLTETPPSDAALKVIRCAPMGQIVYGSTSRIIQCEVLHLSANQIRLNATSNYTVPANAFCVLTLEVNLDVI